MEGWGALIAQSGFAALTWQNLTMFVIAGVLIYLAVTRDYEPLLLVPIGFGAVFANLPFANLSASSTYQPGDGPTALMQLIYQAGIATELLPPLIFLGVGALTDFRPLLARPATLLLGAAAQLGIFVAALAAHHLFGFSVKQAASIGIIGGADGPTTIFLTAILAPELLGAVAVAAYSYMALVPVIQPPILRLLTSRADRQIPIPPERSVSRTAVILFPVLVTVLVALAVPAAAALIGLLMAVWTFVNWWLGRLDANPLGYASLFFSLWLLSGFILITLGMVGLYVGKTFEDVKHRPLYIVKEEL